MTEPTQPNNTVVINTDKPIYLKYTFYVIVAATVAAIGFLGWKSYTLNNDYISISKEYSEYKLNSEQEKATLLANATIQTQKSREKETTLNENLRAALERANESETKLRMVNDRTAATIGQLRTDLQKTANALRHYGQTGQDSPSAAELQTGANAVELFGACTERYRLMAEKASRAHSKGLECEVAYDEAVKATQE